MAARKEKNVNRTILIVFSTLLFIIIGSFLYIQIYLGFHVDAIESTNETENFEYYYNDTLNKEEPAMSSTGTYPVTSSGIDLDALKEPEKKKPKNTSSKNDFTPKKVNTRLGSYQQLINRDYELPNDYQPDDLTEPEVRFSFYGSNDKRKLRKKAASALEELFTAAEESDCILYGVSGFRSYERQSTIYNQNLLKKGSEHTNLYSAKPGTSEHQSGLAIDVSSRSASLQLLENFGKTEEGLWLAKNCWKYGYILRYPEDKVTITGYAYEPWHIRYVGKKLAKYLYKHNLCLDEYYGYEAQTSTSKHTKKKK